MNRYSLKTKTGGVATFLRVRYENLLGRPVMAKGKRHRSPCDDEGNSL